MNSRKAFTLVEILIVVVILGIIAAVVVPKFSNASAAARASMMADDLRVLRSQIAVFKAQHVGVSPGYPLCDTSASPTSDDFIDQMTMSSTPDGETAVPGTAGYRYGPYMREMPENPINGKNTVELIDDGGAFPVAADDSHGWIYQPSTTTLKADSSGIDEYGKNYFDY